MPETQIQLPSCLQVYKVLIEGVLPYAGQAALILFCGTAPNAWMLENVACRDHAMGTICSHRLHTYWQHLLPAAIRLPLPAAQKPSRQAPCSHLAAAAKVLALGASSRAADMFIQEAALLRQLRHRCVRLFK